MYCIKNVTEDLVWVGANDRRLAMFEGVYSVPYGVSYNSYLLKDEKTVLFDTVDKAVRQRFLENLEEALNGRALNYLIVQHMEPDHSAAIGELAEKYPELKIVCNAKTLGFIKQFHDFNIDSRAVIVGEGDTFSTGKHTLNFVMAPMVHWPEVMVTYDLEDKILFSADAFGCFGALNGALFADEVNFDRDYMDEARRYYTNIVGKYGLQVSALLNKASSLEIQMICPLHGFVWRNNIGDIISKYTLWSDYEPEEEGVMIAYASVYGNTENAAEILSCRLREKGVKTVMYDVSVIPSSEIVAAAFRWSHLVFASTTYNSNIFVTMEALLHDLTSHNIQKRTVAVIENGSWAAASGGLMREKFAKCRDITILDNTVSIKSALKKNQLADIAAMADAITGTFGNPPKLPQFSGMPHSSGNMEKTAPMMGEVDSSAAFKLTYGLFVLTARENGNDNGCIINTAAQVTDNPFRISAVVNKANLTCDMIMNTGEFNVSVLTESTPFGIFERFGFRSGKDADKFDEGGDESRTPNGIRYLTEHVNAVFSVKVTQTADYGTHIVCSGEVTESFIISDEASVSYKYYLDNIKPKPKLSKEHKKGYICKICGYIHEGDALPDDFVCPWCKHGASDFERL